MTDAASSPGVDETGGLLSFQKRRLPDWSLLEAISLGGRYGSSAQRRQLESDFPNTIRT